MTAHALEGLRLAIETFLPSETECGNQLDKMLYAELRRNLSTTPCSISATYTLNLVDIYTEVVLIRRPELEKEIRANYTLNQRVRQMKRFFSGCSVSSYLMQDRPTWCIVVSCVA